MIPYWVVFDGPPGPEAGRFVELETLMGRGVGPAESGAEWEKVSGDAAGRLWQLGPFTNWVKAHKLEELLMRWDSKQYLMSGRWPCPICGRKDVEAPLRSFLVLQTDEHLAGSDEGIGARYARMEKRGEVILIGCWLCNTEDLRNETHKFLMLLGSV